ncbi:MAG TPA: PAS domain S-box protein [Nitrospirota bacterium]|nr:PAS domain S-box protein [Nitrospirota bacterium]
MKLLLVDDENDSLRASRIIFESAGFVVAAATNGMEALRLMEASVPDAIIADILMPVMDGFALCQQCKADSRFKDIPFIFYTASYRNAMDKQLAEKLGAARYILKPQLPDDLVRIVKEVLSEKGVSPLSAAPGKPIEAQDFFRLHNEALLRKLEEKIDELEKTNRRLEDDIAERKLTEAALRRSEQRFRMLTTYAPVGIYQTDLKGICIFANKRWCDILSLSPTDVIGQPWTKTIHAEDRETVRLSYSRQDPHAHWIGEFRHIDSAGNTVWVRGSMVSLVGDSGEVLGYLGTSQDITARREAEEAIKQSEKKLRAITSQVGEGIFVYSAEGKITFMNPEAEKLLGWTLEELNAGGMHDMIHSRKPDGTPLSPAECGIQNVLNTGTRFTSMDEVFQRRDGSVFPISTTTAPVMEHGKIVAVVTTFRDISDRKRIEREREKLIDELRESLAKVKTLSGLLPICASCKKIRDDKGYWTRIEAYVSEHSDAEFSHGLCPECAEKIYKEFNIFPPKDSETP